MKDNVTRTFAFISMAIGISSVAIGLQQSKILSDFVVKSEYMYLFFGAFYIFTGTVFAVFSSKISSLMRIISGRRRVALFHLPTSNNRDYIDNLVNELNRKRISVWIDFEEIKAGDDILNTIRHEIANADAAVFIFDQKEFKFLELFLGYAIAAETRVIPISIGGVKIPAEISKISHIVSEGDAASDAPKIVEGVLRSKPKTNDAGTRSVRY